jgi:hypothetical protein
MGVTAFALLANQWRGRQKHRSFSSLGGEKNQKSRTTTSETPAIAMVSLSLRAPTEEEEEQERRKSREIEFYGSLETPTPSGSAQIISLGDHSQIKIGSQHSIRRSRNGSGPAPHVPKRPSVRSHSHERATAGVFSAKAKGLSFDHSVAAPPSERQRSRRRGRLNKLTAISAIPRTSVDRNPHFAETPQGGGGEGDIVELTLFGQGRVLRTRPADGCQVVELVGWRLAGGSKAMLYRFPATQQMHC